jgi:hypothetical protein
MNWFSTSSAPELRLQFAADEREAVRPGVAEIK